MMSMEENTILGFGASRAKAEAVGEIVKLFAGHMSRRESRLTRGAARHSHRLHHKSHDSKSHRGFYYAIIGFSPLLFFDI